MIKLIAVFSLAAILVMAAPESVAAETCTEEYSLCIAESGLLEEPFRSMGDLECGASYVGCVGKRLKFW